MPTDSTIKIKRSTGTTAPSAGTEIVIGELATTMNSAGDGALNKVYLGIQNSGATTTTVAIGGKYYTDKVDSFTSFKTLVVSGQSDVVADSDTDTLTLAAGSGIAITTNASTDTITIANTSSGSVTSITPAGDNGNGTAITTSGTISVIGTANEVNTSVSGTTITVGLPDNVTVGGNLIVTGNVTVNGTTTTVNSTITTIDDPIFTLGGDSAPASDDNKDRGVEYRWHNGTTAKIGFFGMDDTDGTFTFFPDATNTSEVFSGTIGSGKFLSVQSPSANPLIFLGTNTHSSTLVLTGHASTPASTKTEVYGGFLSLAGTSIGGDTFLRFISDPNGSVAGPFNGDIVPSALTNNRTYTLPNVNGTFVTTGNLSAITTVGTISSGTWQGTVIDSTYGGTGVNNAGRTLTIGTGNVTLTAQSGESSVTLPTSGTLATLTGTETLTNKTIDGGTF